MKVRLTSKLISEIGVKEKYLRKNHYNSLKVWWARRPTTAMRSLLILEMFKRNNEIPEVDGKLISDTNPPPSIFKEFSERFKTSEFKVLDVFAGGGSIPFESSRLGFQTFSAELNPVASLLQETIFKSVNVPDYSDKLRKSGNLVIEKLSKKYLKYFDINGDVPYVIYCSKISRCVNCNAEIDLKRLKYLSKRKNRLIYFDENGIIKESSEDNIADNEKSKGFKCANCDLENNYQDIKDFCATNKLDYQPFAICYHNKSGKKTYRKIGAKDSAILSNYKNSIKSDLERLNHLLPHNSVAKKGGVINPTLYDLKKPYDFFSDRQLVVLLGLIDEIITEYYRLLKLYDLRTAKQIVLGLTALIEFLVDWNSMGTMWISQNEQTGRSLAGPGVGMKWDFIEINPFYQTGSNLQSKLNRVCDTFRAIGLKNQVNIIKGSSTSLPLEENLIDIVLTDPPYFDSIDYTGLSEFFRPWFEIVLRNTFSEITNLENNHSLEAIVDLANGEKNGKNQHHYQSLMTDVLQEVFRVLKNDGKAFMLYSHKTFEGWKVIGEAIKDANLFIYECLPLEMERIARPRAMSYEALNGVIVFKMQKVKANIKSVTKDILDLDIQVQKGEILESHKVIYLASLACKDMVLNSKSFDSAYKDVIRQYSKISINRNSDIFDNVTRTYLSKYLGEKNVDIDLLVDNGLYSRKKNKILQLNEINIKLLSSKTQLYKAKTLFEEFKKNSKTKAEIDKVDREVTVKLFSTLSGLNLNTVSKRSSNEIVKVSRLILSKI
ncbi:DNA methyltransferase [Maribacter sp. 2308TA10-17]|uniref:DNA methyltransferase n=1 Tax=Maribacter sp. 2308TA10-17 TaxID=3386276 RepID=UPI0039BC83B9